MLEVHPGYNPSHLTTVQIWIPAPNNQNTDPYAQQDKRAAFLQEIYRRVSVLPGVEQSSVAGNDTLPMNSGRNYSEFTIEGRVAESERKPTAELRSSIRNTFARWKCRCVPENFLPTDTLKAQGVAVIDQTLGTVTGQTKIRLARKLISVLVLEYGV